MRLRAGVPVLVGTAVWLGVVGVLGWGLRAAASTAACELSIDLPPAPYSLVVTAAPDGACRVRKAVPCVPTQAGCWVEVAK